MAEGSTNCTSASPREGSKPKDYQFDTSVELNRRKTGPRVKIDIPVYGGGMSYGSVSLYTMVARAKAAQAWGTFTCTGEGGYPVELIPYKDHVITQIATGLFGVKEETIQRAPIIEFKYAQGAKPGLGGHLLWEKNTPLVAKMREAVPHTSLFSPFPFHSVYSVEDHKKHLDWISSVNPQALLSVKVSTPNDVEMVAVGSYYAGAHIVHLDGGYGGTGAAPEIAKKNIATPIEYAIPKVHRFLTNEGIREDVTLIASGGIRNALDVAKAIALGADGVVIGTAELVALGCVRCGNCESGRGCPRGIATTDPELIHQMDTEWGAKRISNLFLAWRGQWGDLLSRFDMHDLKELRGRTDLLRFDGGKEVKAMSQTGDMIKIQRMDGEVRDPLQHQADGGGGRLRRGRAGQHGRPARTSLLRIAQADAQPRQRQGRRHRRRRPGPQADAGQPRGARQRLPDPGGLPGRQCP